MNKNWNDRADKDLFFTILSVKNIGVISGAEWTTIGNHMRSLDYGFTNEGCRYVIHKCSFLFHVPPQTDRVCRVKPRALSVYFGFPLAVFLPWACGSLTRVSVTDSSHLFPIFCLPCP